MMSSASIIDVVWKLKVQVKEKKNHRAIVSVSSTGLSIMDLV